MSEQLSGPQAWRIPKVRQKLLKKSPSSNSGSRMGDAPPTVQKKDHLRSRYVSFMLDQIWSIDQTWLKNDELIIIQDQSSREILGYRLIKGGASARDVVELISRTISFTQRPKMVHTDAGGIFVSPPNAKHPENHQLYKYLKSEDITHSVTVQRKRPGSLSKKRHGNNVHERLNGSLKTRIKELLQAIPYKGSYATPEGRAWRQTPEGKTWIQKGWLIDFAALTFEKAEDLLYSAVSAYNSRYHRMLDTSPIVQANALAAATVTAKRDAVYLPALATKKSAAGKAIIKKKLAAVADYQEDWGNFFKNWQNKSMLSHAETQLMLHEGFTSVISSLKSANENLTRELTEAHVSLDEMSSRMQSMETNLTYLQDRERDRELEEKEKEDRRKMRSARKRLPLRDPVYSEAYNAALNLIEGTHFCASRDRVCLLILYLTGVRARSLLHVTGAHLHTMLNFLDGGEGQLSFPGIKSPTARAVHVPLTRYAASQIKELKHEIERLLKGRGPEDRVMVRFEGHPELLSITNLNKRLNRILKKASAGTCVIP
ncbi:putative integrase/recombinase protein (mitochondrion) [Bryopsis sp. KO-2023]|nr:putative integrase/recombinase protein [Bryopsis sp. KO-2023]